MAYKHHKSVIATSGNKGEGVVTAGRGGFCRVKDILVIISLGTPQSNTKQQPHTTVLLRQEGTKWLPLSEDGDWQARPR